MQNYKRLLHYLRPYIPHFALSIVLTLLFSAANVLILPWTRDIVNEIANKNMSFFINQVCNGVALWTMRVITQFGQVYVMAWISQRLLIDLQLDLYSKLMQFSQHFYSHWKLGEILTRMFSDTDRIKSTLILAFKDVLPQTFTAIGVLGYLFYMNWKLTAFTLISVPLFIALISYFATLLKRITHQIQKKIADITHIAQESLSNVKLAQAYTMEEFENNRYRRENMRNFKANMIATRFKATMDAIVLFAQGLVFLMVLFVGGKMVASGELTGSELFSFFAGIGLLIDPVSALSNVYVNIQQANVSIDRVYELYDMPVKIKNPKNGLKPSLEGAIQIKDLTFAYDESNISVLKKINLDVKPDETIALVGLSGAGKTTLINMIPRFYDPSQGEITIDNTPLKEIDLYHLRSQIGIVLQDNILFRGTILENIRYGSPQASEAEIIQAAKKANAWEFISEMPDGLRAKVGDEGTRLSGGQKQRIAIARAILRNPRILILDEATSALDSKSEKLVQAALIELMKDRTTFVIAHRLSTIRHADRIVVLDQGEIKEIGTHEALLQQDGAYAKLYHLQFQKQNQ